MLSKSLSRRQLLSTLGSTAVGLSASGLGGAGLTLFSQSTQASSQPEQQYLQLASSATQKIEKDKQHQLLSLQGATLGQTISGWRGHQVAVSPDQRYLVSIARRPGRQLLVLDQTTGQHFRVQAAEQRHYYGHGIFSADQRRFYCPENDYDNARGVIGVYDVNAGFKRINEWSSYGIGPHQIAWLPKADQQPNPIMVVANGGLETHPDYPRIILNPDSMQPNLSYIDQSGALIDQVKPDHHQLSLRHLDVTEDGQVWVGAQYQGLVHESPTLIFNHRIGQKKLQEVDAQPALWAELQGYIASVSAHPKQDTLCITAPKANSVTFWQRTTGQLIARQKLSDCAGVCAHPSKPFYIVSNGEGDLVVYHASTGNIMWQTRFDQLHWDNHLTWIG
ncbi:hypothetical protein SAMN02745127_01491 [Oceanospirillum multiglobuliferum]|uniref:DUF1513 domain-containing protein n=1 Tax=Oceanospirillum multiglobuliferum TaxID=64969 RepID=A0A1T4PH75_9GAMM|nr:DUF1513 domain-containing protein [Oceanospirillum multiglobuliferum]OPX55553.1 hypothetical protein BTE48_07985 [Oceanospirillum multiglobuliferum]SJZ90697.1 hypothetical protein SAMN02745127_01491 [Oceanospirillum multiglobuliferum]